MNKPKLLVFASGSAEGGGSGFEKLVLASQGGPLNADIVAVVSNHENGGEPINSKFPSCTFPSHGPMKNTSD